MPNNATPKGSGTHKFHVVLANDEERDVIGDDARVDAGALVIRTHAGDAVIYAPGEWRLCELRRQDDRG